jgi:hypothetical protein
MNTYQIPKPPSPKAIVIAMLLLFAIVVALSSCAPKYPVEKAIEQVNKANNKYPSPVADWLRGKYPCITRSADTVITSKDSVVYVDCPDLPVIVHEPGSTDTIIQTQTKVIRVPVTLPVQVQTITKYIEDSAKIKVMTVEIGDLKNEGTKLQQKYDDMKESRDWYKKWFFILLGIVVVYVGLRVFTKIPFIK